VIGTGSISGAVGTHANVSAEVERHVLDGLGLTADPAPTQVVSRDRHAELLTVLAILGGTLERIAVEIRHLQRTEVGEAFEPFGAASRAAAPCPTSAIRSWPSESAAWPASSAADALVALENMALWHERDISHSSAERFIFERALGVAAYATRTLADLLDGLEVDVDRMRANLGQLGGMVYSEALLLAMIAKGADRQEAYRLVQAAAKRAWAGEASFREALGADPAVGEWLTEAEIDRAMDLDHHLAGIEVTYRALGLDDGRVAADARSMRRWWIEARAAATIVADHGSLWLPGALAWSLTLGWIPLVVAVARPPNVADLTFLGARIYSSGAWPWNAFAAGAGALLLVGIGFLLVGVAEATLATSIARRRRLRRARWLG
jgi:hypothetical protein